MITRRQAIGSSLLATVAGSAFAGGPADEGGPADVIIIGAGFAGVTAARELAHAGRRCVLLEARNRVGGRTFSTRVFGRQGDVGGQWIHWLQPHVWTEVTRYGLALYETPGAANPASVGVLTDGALVRQTPADNFAMIQSSMAQLCAESRRMFPQPFSPAIGAEFADLDRLSVQDRLATMKLDPLARAAISAYVTTNVNASPSDAGLVDQIHWYARAGHDMERLLQACAQFKLADGTIALLNRMMADAGCRLELNCPVRTVRAGDGSVTAVAEDGREFRARALVVALPMNCWADIDWQPAIRPEKLAASRRRHAGSGFELHLKVDGDVGSYMAMAALPNPISLLYTDRIEADGTVLVGLGPSSVQFDINDFDAVARELKRLLPEATLRSSFAYDWNADPYSKGTWCNYRPGMWTELGAAMRAPEGRVVFAGSDVADGWRGFIDGAIESGLRAARTVRSLLA
jgi:monoamine oxidase